MPQLRVLHWNIETFGDENGFRARQARVGFVAATVLASQADILLIQEVRQNAIANLYLPALQEALNSLPAPFNNWYFDVIKGALDNAGAHPATYAYNTAADLMWDAGHYEGYAVFWNQNIAKFIMQAAPPIDPPWGAGPVANTQSMQCQMMGAAAMGGGLAPMYGMAVPGGGLQVPGGGTPFVVPAGTNIPGHGVLNAATPMAAGTVIPANTVVGPGGITLNAQTNNVNPVVVPAGATLGDALTLPVGGTVLVPQNALGLVLFGRDSADPADPNHAPATLTGNISAATDNFNPAGANVWNWLEFTQGAGGPAARTGSRRPAYVTLRVNRPGLPTAADQLVPIIVYHAPSKAPASSAGMQRSAYSQPMYQAYDWGTNQWINCNNAVLGGDFNVATNGVAYAYNAFTAPWGPAGGQGGGAGATMAIANPAPPGGTMADATLNKSMVSLTYGVGGPDVYSANLAAFRALAIDNVFYRGMGGAAIAAGTVLPDLLVASTTGGGVLNGAPVQNCLNTPTMVNVGHSVYVTGAPITVNQMVDAVTTMFEMNAGAFGTQPNYNAQSTGARRVGEFVDLFVSDHLPVATQFNM